MDTETERLAQTLAYAGKLAKDWEEKVHNRYGPAEGSRIVSTVMAMQSVLCEISPAIARGVIRELPSALASVLAVQRQIDGTVDPVVQALDNLNGDPESDHGTAEDLVLGQLRELGRSDIADAFTRARDRVGFWYA